LLKAAMESDFRSMIDLEAEKQNMASVSEDFKAATEAFFKKERPEFSGR